MNLTARTCCQSLSRYFILLCGHLFTACLNKAAPENQSLAIHAADLQTQYLCRKSPSTLSASVPMQSELVPMQSKSGSKVADAVPERITRHPCGSMLKVQPPNTNHNLLHLWWRGLDKRRSIRVVLEFFWSFFGSSQKRTINFSIHKYFSITRIIPIKIT